MRRTDVEGADKLAQVASVNVRLNIARQFSRIQPSFKRSQKLGLLLFLVEGFAETFDSGPTALHDVLLQLQIVRHRVITIEARHAKAVLGKSGCLHEPVVRQVGE